MVLELAVADAGVLHAAVGMVEQKNAFTALFFPESRLCLPTAVAVDLHATVVEHPGGTAVKSSLSVVIATLSVR
jgi:hypothetical protein